MDLILLSSEEPVGNVKVKGSLGRSAHEMVNSRSLGQEGGWKSTSTPGLQEGRLGPL